MIKRMAEKMQTIHNSCFGIGQDHIKDIYDYIDQLEADKLEAYRAIVDNKEYVYECPEYGNIVKMCNFCEEEIPEHDKDCIVLKAEKYIREVTE